MTDTHALPTQDGSLRRYCTACGSPSEVSARFCGQCGLTLDESTRPDGAEVHASRDVEVDSSRPRRRHLLIGAGIALVVVLAVGGMAAVALMNQPGAEEAVLAEAAGSAEDLLGDMAAADLVADLGAVAADADDANEPVTDMVSTLDPASDTAQALTGLDELFTALSALSDIDGDTLDAWPQVRGDIETALDDLPADAAGTEALADVGEEALEATDTLIAEAEQALADWEASVAAAEQVSEQNAAASEELSTYEDAVAGQLRIYNSLRNDTADFVALVESPGSYVTWGQGYDAMSSGATARREVRDALNAIAIPDGMQAEHARLVGMVEDATAAMDAGYSGLSQADACFYGDCYYADTQGWREFQNESSRITGEFAAAKTTWETQLASQRAALIDVTAIDKPIV